MVGWIVAHIDQVIMFCAGAWGTAVGWGRVSVSRNAEAQQKWLARFGPPFRVLGPVLMLIALALAAAR